MFQARTITSSDITSIRAFVKKFVVEEEFVMKYLKHLELLDLKKRKRAEKRQAPKIARQASSSSSQSSDEESQSSDEEVLAEIEHVSSSSESEIETTPRYSRSSSGRRCTTYRTRHFFGDSD